IHDAIDIGVRQTRVSDNSKGKNEHQDQDHNQARYDWNEGCFEGIVVEVKDTMVDSEDEAVVVDE
ncbi:hypothetical protein KI387_021099, partial [Taxus chinensis]